MKIASGSMIRVKSRPRTEGYRRISSPPPRANGIRKRGRPAVTAPRIRDQAERADWEMRPASGMVSEPMIGIKIVRRTICSVLITCTGKNIRSEYINRKIKCQYASSFGERVR